VNFVALEPSVGSLTEIVVTDRPLRYKDKVGRDECPCASTEAHKLVCFLGWFPLIVPVESSGQGRGPNCKGSIWSSKVGCSVRCSWTYVERGMRRVI
jgi:hypothetical protein